MAGAARIAAARKELARRELARRQREKNLADATRDASVELDKAGEAENASFVDKALTFGQGAAEAASFGLADEAAGAWEALPTAGKVVLGAVPGAASLVGLPALVGSAIANPEDYKRGRDAHREKVDTSLEVAPAAFGAGNVAGTAAQVLAGGAGGAAPATIGSAVKQGAKLGAGTGAVSGFGAGEGAEDSVARALLQGGAGALMGGAAGGIAKAISDPLARAAAARTGASGGRAVLRPLRNANRSDVADLAENLPLVGKPLGALRKKVAELGAREPPAQTLDDFVRSLPEEPLPPIADRGVLVPKQPSSAPVASLDDAAELSGMPATPRTPSRQQLLDEKLAEAQQVVRARAQTPERPMEGTTPLTPEEQALVVPTRGERDTSAGRLLRKKKPAEPAKVDSSSTRAATALRKKADGPQRPAPVLRKKPGWSDELDEAGVDPGLGSPMQRNPMNKRKWKAASDSISEPPTKGSLQRMPEQVKEPATVVNEQQIDEVAGYIRTLAPAQQSVAVANIRTTFGPEAAMAVARKLGMVQ